MPYIPPKNGLPVSFRNFNFGEMVRREWGSDWNVPDIVYEMTDGRKFESTDMQTSGIYKRK